jgi:hypothetical protein
MRARLVLAGTGVLWNQYQRSTTANRCMLGSAFGYDLRFATGARPLQCPYNPTHGCLHGTLVPCRRHQYSHHWYCGHEALDQPTKGGLEFEKGSEACGPAACCGRAHDVRREGLSGPRCADVLAFRAGKTGRARDTPRV